MREARAHGLVAEISRVLANPLVDATLRGSVDHLLGLRGQAQHVVRVKLEHVAVKHRVQAALGVLGVREKAEERLDDADLRRAREGRAARHDALEAALAQGVDVGARTREGAHQHGHAPRCHALLADAGEAVRQLGGGDPRPRLAFHGHGAKAMGARQLDHDARARVLRKIALARRLGMQVHE